MRSMPPTGGSCAAFRERAGEKIFQKNTMDLQWKIGTNYNASHCVGERKTPGARTMDNNEKNNAENNGKRVSHAIANRASLAATK
jgi:hypothetical protein